MRLGWTPRRIDKTTGDWADQPTNFISVICYRKVAENAALCLRRGDPVVVKGNLRVREYGDENGPKRTAVEVVADTIGHDLSRGITIFKKSTEQLEKTAAEREQEMAAAAREPLPGDRGSAERAGNQPDGYQPDGYQPDGYQPDGDYPVQGGSPGHGQDPAGGYAAELEPDDHEQASGEEFDDDEARQLMAQTAEAAEPVGAAS
jgi:single-strand DNA-binding protein